MFYVGSLVLIQVPIEGVLKRKIFMKCMILWAGVDVCVCGGGGEGEGGVVCYSEAVDVSAECDACVECG